MLWAAGSARTVVDLAGCGLGGRDQVGCGLEARLIVRDQPPLNGGYQRHRLEILQYVPPHLRLQVGNHGHDAVVEAADRIAVGFSACDLLGADQPGGTGQIQDDDLLAHIVGHLLGHEPRGDIDRTCRRQRHDHLDRPVRIAGLRNGLRVEEQRKRQDQRTKRAASVIPISWRQSATNASRRDLLGKSAPYRLAWQSLEVVRDMRLILAKNEKSPAAGRPPGWLNKSASAGRPHLHLARGLAAATCGQSSCNKFPPIERHAAMPRGSGVHKADSLL